MLLTETERLNLIAEAVAKLIGEALKGSMGSLRDLEAIRTKLDDDLNARRPETTEPPRYVIINEIDAPEPRMVCQWVPEIGYCYMDRSNGKPRHDGMTGFEATPVEAFGWAIAEDEDGGSWTRFYRADRPPTATYRDGEPRRWQHAGTYFEFKRLKMKVAA